MLTSGRKMSSARRERPMASPIADARDRGERKAGGEAEERVEHVVRQDPAGGQADEGRGDVFQRRKQLARKDAEIRGEFPKHRHHQERKGGARDDAPAAFARRRRGRSSENVARDGRREIGHDLRQRGQPQWHKRRLSRSEQSGGRDRRGVQAQSHMLLPRLAAMLWPRPCSACMRIVVRAEPSPIPAAKTSRLQTALGTPRACVPRVADHGFAGVRLVPPPSPRLAA